MNNKKFIIANILAILTQILNYILQYYNIDKLGNPSDIITGIALFLNYALSNIIIISIIVQFIVLMLIILNKKHKQLLNIISLVIEIILIIPINIVFLILWMSYSTKIFSFLIYYKLLVIIFDILSIYIIVFLVKRIWYCKKYSLKNKILK